MSKKEELVYTPFSIIQGGKVEQEVDVLPVTIESKASRSNLIYFVAIPSGIIGAFTDKSLVEDCLHDYPEAQVIELVENIRLDRL